MKDRVRVGAINGNRVTLLPTSIPVIGARYINHESMNRCLWIDSMGREHHCQLDDWIAQAESTATPSLSSVFAAEDEEELATAAATTADGATIADSDDDLDSSIQRKRLKKSKVKATTQEDAAMVDDDADDMGDFVEDDVDYGFDSKSQRRNAARAVKASAQQQRNVHQPFTSASTPDKLSKRYLGSWILALLFLRLIVTCSLSLSPFLTFSQCGMASVV